jgi:hypothetical protein
MSRYRTKSQRGGRLQPDARSVVARTEREAYPIVMTTRKRAFPLIIRSYPSLYCSNL